ncbi:MAG: DUF692 domain-containing protein [bacterium]|nr:DUF692 domain-containing protein [bacterium]
MFSGVGLGFRRDLADILLDSSLNRSTAAKTATTSKPDFIEITPENWLGIGGKWHRAISQAQEQYTLSAHGLSLSLGSSEPLDLDFLKQLKDFFRQFPVSVFSEHLSYAKCGNAHLYDLLPVPFREDAVKHVVERIRFVQDFLERPIAIENVSYYTPLAPEMTEAEFVRAVVEESDCQLLLDVNNVYVNAFNHNYNAREFINSLPLERVRYIHMAGHEQVDETLIIDTHGEAIIEPVYDLFAYTMSKLPPVPVLLERDFNFPDYAELEEEMARLNKIMSMVQQNVISEDFHEPDDNRPDSNGF